MAHAQKKRRTLGRGKALELQSLPGFPRAEILRFGCVSGKLIREEAGANNRSSWQDVFSSPRGKRTLNSVRASVPSVLHEGRSAMENGGKPSFEIPTVIKITNIKCALWN